MSSLTGHDHWNERQKCIHYSDGRCKVSIDLRCDNCRSFENVDEKEELDYIRYLGLKPNATSHLVSWKMADDSKWDDCTGCILNSVSRFGAKFCAYHGQRFRNIKKCDITAEYAQMLRRTAPEIGTYTSGYPSWWLPSVWGGFKQLISDVTSLNVDGLEDTFEVQPGVFADILLYVGRDGSYLFSGIRCHSKWEIALGVDEYGNASKMAASKNSKDACR